MLDWQSVGKSVQVSGVLDNQLKVMRKLWAYLKLLCLNSVRIGVTKLDASCFQNIWGSFPGLVQILFWELLELGDPSDDIGSCRILQEQAPLSL